MLCQAVLAPGPWRSLADEEKAESIPLARSLQDFDSNKSTSRRGSTAIWTEMSTDGQSRFFVGYKLPDVLPVYSDRRGERRRIFNHRCKYEGGRLWWLNIFEDQKVQSWTALRTFGASWAAEILERPWRERVLRKLMLHENDGPTKAERTWRLTIDGEQTVRDSVVSGNETRSLGIEVFKVMAVILLCVAGLWTAQSKLFLDHIHS